MDAVSAFVKARWTRYQKKFRHNPGRDSWIYLCVVLVGATLSMVCLLEPVLHNHCDLPRPKTFPYKNPLFDDSPCRRMRYRELLGLTPEETDMGRRMFSAVALAAMIGYERRQADRPAGIRTMSVTGLGAACFTISSIYAFESGAVTWDASRVSAAIPSGVGFLGSALIFKEKMENGEFMVSGLATAASVWISAAIGVACGGALYYPAAFCTFVVCSVLRFGPRGRSHHDEEDEDDDCEEAQEEETAEEQADCASDDVRSESASVSAANPGVSEKTPLLPGISKRTSGRQSIVSGAPSLADKSAGNAKPKLQQQPSLASHA
ncbi:Protein MgtC [Porphyridium purpureum]|uniref:Protein MgtC n=1 Tax=Porphyridium purpureum TaxID=35688 RepID=A0A5J4Z3D6_PORPP|nr:Protein MgtC [Porphyridium purpureum]|eukprot:POR2792..scf295_1